MGRLVIMLFRKSFKVIEILGMIFLLLAIGLEFSIDKAHDNILSDFESNHIMIRLDEIHQRQFDLQKTVNGLAEQIYENRSGDIAFVEKRKFYTNYTGLTKEDRNRFENWKTLRLWLFFIGSILLVVAKTGDFFQKDGSL